MVSFERRNGVRTVYTLVLRGPGNNLSGKSGKVTFPENPESFDLSGKSVPSKERTAERKRNVNGAAAAAAATLPETSTRQQQQHADFQYPKTKAEIQLHDAGMGNGFMADLVKRTLEAATRAGVDPALVTDNTLCAAVIESYRTYRGKKAHGTGLLLHRVPEIICAWDKQEDDSDACTCGHRGTCGACHRIQAA
jgi:hypothetical protein